MVVNWTLAIWDLALVMLVWFSVIQDRMFMIVDWPFTYVGFHVGEL